ncbi:unnamed protein product [Adineta steineri]|uniref:Phosphoribosyl-AMP cyclohydrolase domain-containing protein n=1 Tax=Adineta steineri TaxID=433720 RepID=A0A814T9B8_9BILA|nr:unnamed protein product [Adineta steineri]CAF3998877.1 unnamed protein product [Adineta steineri]
MGNRACGKSSICQLINSAQRNKNIIAIECGDQLASEYAVNPSLVDRLVFEYPFDDAQFQKINLCDRTENHQQIFWIILDCEVETILKRIQGRPKKDIWHTKKSLYYYQQRYRHLAAHFGIPFLDTTHLTLEQVSVEILDIIEKYATYYRYFRQIGTQNLTHQIIEECDIEHQLYQIIKPGELIDLPDYAHELSAVDQQKLYTRCDLIDDIPPIEIIVKRYCEGTDRNSFSGIMDNRSIMLANSTGEYLSGPYVRFDWKNPSHISPSTNIALSENLYYYIYEQLADPNRTKFDKDIWEVDKSASREQTAQRWNDFNSLLKEYFLTNRFDQTELFDSNSYFYVQEIHQLLTNDSLRIPRNLQDLWFDIRGKTHRRILVTMDMFNAQPVLVQSSQVCELHSHGDYQQAISKLAIFPDMLIVDLNGAFGESNTMNRQIIKQLACKYHVHTGGGLRSLADLQEMLNSGVRRCVMASAEDTLMVQIPKDRLIAEISINECNEVLIHGRRTNTHVNVITRIHQLVDIGVDTISITFVHTEGHLSGIPREQIRNLLVQIPCHIEKVYIAGGVSSLDDLDFLWSFPRVIPILGSAIWKNQLSIGSIYNRMIYFDDKGTVPAVIQDNNGVVKGLCYMNEQSIEKTCEHRLLYRYSRKLRRVIMKGETSGDLQQIIQMSLDCDSDALMITVDSKRPFCHMDKYSCFNVQTSIKANFATLADHIRLRMDTDSYTGKIQRNPAIALVKLMEEVWEIVATQSDHQIAECSDLIVHLIMYLNGMRISIEEICNELNRRRWLVRSLTESMRCTSEEVIIGITNSKYTGKTDRFAEEELGIRIVRPTDRSLHISGQIVDAKKFTEHFGNDTNLKFTLFPSKPKDMPWLLATQRVTHLITFDSVVKNYPLISSAVHEIIDPTICLALLCRQVISTAAFYWIIDLSNLEKALDALQKKSEALSAERKSDKMVILLWIELMLNLSVIAMKEGIENETIHNDKLITLWKKTFGYRRSFIRSHTINEILEKFPGYSYTHFMFEEVKMIENIDIEQNVNEILPRLFDKLPNNSLFVMDLLPIRVIKLLCKQFNQSISHILVDNEPIVPAPCIKVTIEKFELYLDWKLIIRTTSPTTALALLLSLYNVFATKFAKNNHTSHLLYGVFFQN